MANRYYRIIYLIICAAALPLFFSCEKKAAVTSADNGGRAPEQTVQKEQLQTAKKGMEEARGIPVATVNGAVVTMHDLVREMNAIAPRFIPDGQKTTPELDREIRKHAIERLIFTELALQEAKQQGISVKPEEVDWVIANIRKQMGSEKEYRKYLEQSGLTQEELKRRIERSRCFEMITAKQIYGKISIEDQEIKKVYDKEKVTFEQMPRNQAEKIIRRRLVAETGEKIRAQWEQKLRKKAAIQIMADQKKG